MQLSIKKIHRWLGLSLGWLMLIWFISGAVMMYAAMPRLSTDQRLGMAKPLKADQVRLDFAQAWRKCGQTAPPKSMRLGSLAEWPVYFFLTRDSGFRVVRADSGTLLDKVSPELALASAQAGFGSLGPIIPAGVTDKDQWTVGTGSLKEHRPLYEFQAQDQAGTRIYVSSRTGEVCQVNTSSQRFWAWLGAVPHWLYFTVLRQHLEFWRWSIILLSALGCLLCLSGIWLGARYFRWRGWGQGKHRRKSVYLGWRRWHHYLGLIFGLPLLTWTFSGMLSLHPFDWCTPSKPSPAIVNALSGGTPRPDNMLLHPAQAIAALPGAVKELRVINFQGESYYHYQDSAKGSRLIPAKRPEALVLKGISLKKMSIAAQDLVPGYRVGQVELLDKGDLYTRKAAGPLLRVQYDDPNGTWLYLDQRKGSAALVMDRTGRINRWLYRFLHCFDLPWLMANRWLRDPLMLLLLLGGAGVCFSGPWAWLVRLKRRRAGGGG